VSSEKSSGLNTSPTRPPRLRRFGGFATFTGAAATPPLRALRGGECARPKNLPKKQESTSVLHKNSFSCGSCSPSGYGKLNVSNVSETSPPPQPAAPPAK